MQQPMAPPTPNMVCVACGVPVFCASAATRGLILLDLDRPAYAVHWLPDAPGPRCVQVEGYGEHVCCHTDNFDLLLGDLSTYKDPP